MAQVVALAGLSGCVSRSSGELHSDSSISAKDVSDRCDRPRCKTADPRTITAWLALADAVARLKLTRGAKSWADVQAQWSQLLATPCFLAAQVELQGNPVGSEAEIFVDWWDRGGSTWIASFLLAQQPNAQQIVFPPSIRARRPANDTWLVASSDDVLREDARVESQRFRAHFEMVLQHFATRESVSDEHCSARDGAFNEWHACEQSRRQTSLAFPARNLNVPAHGELWFALGTPTVSEIWTIHLANGKIDVLNVSQEPYAPGLPQRFSSDRELSREIAWLVLNAAQSFGNFNLFAESRALPHANEWHVDASHRWLSTSGSVIADAPTLMASWCDGRTCSPVSRHAMDRALWQTMREIDSHLPWKTVTQPSPADIFTAQCMLNAMHAGGDQAPMCTDQRGTP